MLLSITKNFTFNIISRIMLIVAVSIACTYVLLTKKMLFAPVVILIVLVIVVVDLIRYIRKTTKYLGHALSALKESAYSDSISTALRNDNASLSNMIQEVSSEFSRVSIEREIHFQFLRTIIENINVGILIIEPDHTIRLANTAAKKMLQLNMIRTSADLKQADPKLENAANTMLAGDKQLIRIQIGDQLVQLAIHVREVVQRDINLRIFLLQNIGAELDAKEIEAWQKLTQVLTHEIMNSVTPISSLTDAIQNIISENGQPKDLTKLDKDTVEDIHHGVATISARSKSLMKFVSAYKEFSRTPELKTETLDIVSLTQKVINLFEPDIARKKITLTTQYPKKSLEVKGDPVLLEQVLINLVKNAMEAVPDDGSGLINILVRKEVTTQVSISDNGHGIPADVLDKIFIPFFTTKQKGSGIGLSLSRQIMRLHEGNIRVKSSSDEGSVFSIEW